MSRKERLKVYHGLPKSNMDEHTLLYIDFDGNTLARNTKTSLAPKTDNIKAYTSCVTGNGANMLANTTQYTLEVKDIICIDFFIEPTGDILTKASVVKTILQLLDASNKEIIGIGRSNSTDGWAGGLSNGNFFNVFNATTFSERKISHIRIVIDATKNLFMFYENGNLMDVKGSSSSSSPILPSVSAFNSIVKLNIGANSTSGYTLSDLHISSIDRGDYFPNLPQDFIDGKAIIRPRMGQQQIKGDPLYSQETVDIVKIGNNVNEPQITCSRTTGNWTSGDTIKVKGLNNEIVSGVIDTDTALCKITELPTTSSTTQVRHTISVNDSSKLNVGDNLVWVNNTLTKTGTVICSVESISGNSVTLLFNSAVNLTSINIGDFFFEITSTSSSPTVTTSDGITVTGTWSNLGTNEATFTLGTNASLTTQDLYVTYSLNIPPNNSDFTQIPYTINRVYDELGNELKEVSSLVLEDDFRYKVALSDIECPHKCYSHIGATLKNPSEITGNFSTGFEEISLNSAYDSLAYLDSNLRSITGGSATRPQHLFTFNILEMVERKMGKIPSIDKIAWLKSNISRLDLNYNIGSSSSVYVQAYVSNRWTGSNTHMGGVQAGVFPITQISEAIQPNGCVHFLVFGELNSTSIYIDYLKISVTLKLDDKYKTYFNGSTRARENPCNPILIQPETKTVKRYLPSTECFSTEISYASLPTVNDLPMLNKVGRKLSSHGRYFLSSLGTGSTHTKFTGENLNQLPFKDILYKYNGNNFIEVPYNLLVTKSSNNDYGNLFTRLETVSDPTVSVLQGLLTTKFGESYKSSHGISRAINNLNSLIPNEDNINNYYGIAVVLYEYKNEVYLLISNTPPNFDMSSVGSPVGLSNLYKIPNRPLIK